MVESVSQDASQSPSSAPTSTTAYGKSSDSLSSSREVTESTTSTDSVSSASRNEEDASQVKAQSEGSWSQLNPKKTGDGNEYTTNQPRASSEEVPQFRQAMAPMMVDPAVTVFADTDGNHLTKPEYEAESTDIGEKPPTTLPSYVPTTSAQIDFNDPLVLKLRLQQCVAERGTAYHDEIRSCFLKSTQEGPSQPRTFLLLSGPSGSGKRYLPEAALAKVVQEQEGGFFVQGRYDSPSRPVPYSGLVMAFSSFTKQVLLREEREKGFIDILRQDIFSHLGTCADVSVLTSMIPALGSILGCGDASADGERKKTANNDDPLQRFIFAFCMFIRAITHRQPLVLVLHDLHQADPCSLDILSGIATYRGGEGCNNLFLVGTCDDSLVSQEAYLARKLREMEDSRAVRIHSISLPQQSHGTGEHIGAEMESWLSQALLLSLDNDHTTLDRLARIIQRHCHGDWFLLVELIQWLQESDLLSFDVRQNQWKLASPEDVDVVFNTGKCFLVEKLEHQLSQETLLVLRASACLGSTIDSKLLELVLDSPVGETMQELSKLGLLGVVSSSSDCETYMFEHDCVQQAAYSLIPEPELFHLEIGRRLWRKLSNEALEDTLFVVLSQMYVGRRLITREKERVAIATLCLHAGKKAAKSSTFRTASSYLQMGLDLLTSPSQRDLNDIRCWRDEYELTLALHCAAAEMAMCCANFDETHRLLKPVFDYARTREDKLQAYTTKMYSLSQQGQQQECLDLGMCVLRELGETFPRRLCMAHVMKEMRSVGNLLKNKSNEQISRMPHIRDSSKISALNILNFMILAAITHRPKLAPFVFLKMTKITLVYGLSVFASGAFGTYGMLYISATCDVEKGARFAELALLLMEKFGGMVYLPRVYAAVFGCIHAWTKPTQSALGPLLHAYRVGMQTGDTEYGGLCANLYCFYAFDSGVNLSLIRQEYKSMKESLMTAKQAYMLQMFLPTMQMIHHFMGLSDDPLSTKGDLMDYDEFAEFIAQGGSNLGGICLKVNRMVMGYMFGDLLMAEENLLSCKEIMETPPTFERVAYLFYIGLVSVAVAREGRNYRKNMQSIKVVLKWMRRISQSSPHNALDKSNLLQAEMASMLNQKTKAYSHYFTAVALSSETGNLFMKGLSNQLCGRHLVRLGDNESRIKAKDYYLRSIEAYQEWGGVALVALLQNEMNSIFGSRAEAINVESCSPCAQVSY